jgi:hypothetical protein
MTSALYGHLVPVERDRIPNLDGWTGASASHIGRFLRKKSGDVLLSQGDAPQVPSALAGLTAVFGMGTGVAPPPWSPENLLRADRAPA